MTRHLKLSYVSIFANLLRTDNEKKIEKNYIQLDQLKRIKKTKSRLNKNMKMLLNRGKKIPYVQVKEKNTKS